ncbi:imelysin [Leptospira interrogans str. 2003000735]|uniref:Imelysin n=2 Tax=Leptospira interrogans TaxID=173 RepID=A0A829D0J2_LEPIR|nr:imelysin family protein [Leptospira interrogans]EMY05742.1 imelysin [Leptospira interrogans str. 2002000626]EMY22737.1 imelysin [Leptospira interrogans serovar Australis str. 200703203]EKN90747.1 imelysin [Leptospira interrogans str. 2002000624]EKQ38075.1 imelysin [Leptospira interrogans str. 2002000621]EKQ47113.1 imelysin [Leptospira interrogans str. 2002000623]
MNLKKITHYLLLWIVVSFLFSNCKSEANNDSERLALLMTLFQPTATRAQVVDRYLQLGYESYDQSYKDAVAFQTAVTAFAANNNPTAADHINLKNLYVVARASYLTTEAFRFSSGPIDNVDILGCGSNADGSGDEECEGLINGWPLDESAIDNYINNNNAAQMTYANVLAVNGDAGANGGANDDDDETALTVGWHAIEYILWGQDLFNGGVNQISGQRTVADLSGAAGTDGHKRRTYMKAVTDGLVLQLKLIRDQFEDGARYSDGLKSNPDAAVTYIFQGLGKFIAGEWGGERLTGTFGGQQEEEHSCFSDTTKADFYYNAQSVLNIWNGSYELKKGTVTSTGPGLKNLFGTFNVPGIGFQATAARDTFCINLSEQTADPNYTTSCKPGSLTGRYDQIIRNTDNEYQILFDVQKFIGDKMKKTITDAAKTIGISITDFSI